MSEQPVGAAAQEQHVVVIGPDGQPVGSVPASVDRRRQRWCRTATTTAAGGGVTDLVEQPAKVMRIGSMIRQLLEEVKAAPLDEASRNRLKEIHRASIAELESGLAPELVEELERLSLPFTEDGTPSEGELRIAQAQLVGWLEGLFHGIQTAIYAQQMAARAQLEQMRRQLPGGDDAAAGGRLPGRSPPQPGHGRVRRHVPLSPRQFRGGDGPHVNSGGSRRDGGVRRTSRAGRRSPSRRRGRRPG